MKSKPEMIFSLLWRMREGKKKKVRLVLHFCLQKKRGGADGSQPLQLSIFFVFPYFFFFSFDWGVLSVG